MIEPRVKIRMKETANGADDHVNVKEYQKGRTYEISESLANVFITADPPLAVRVSKKEPEPEETKVIEPEEMKDEELEEPKAEEPPEKEEKKKK
ncbi:hypothetical protein ES703_55112 [subsurface metagenome]